MARWYLASVEVSGGFLAGLNLELPRGLTCVIGPRGSGKSTFAEAVRYALGCEPPGRPRSDLVQANLANAVVTLTTSLADGEPGYTVTRVPREPPTLVDAAGASVHSVKLERGTFLPLDAYGSAEIEDIAQESLGEKRRALLDDLRPEALHALRASIAEKRRGLEASADAIRGGIRRLGDIKESIESLGGARTKLAALPTVHDTGSGAALTAAAKRRSRNRAEAAALATATQAAEARRDAAESLAAEVERTVTLRTEAAGDGHSDLVEAAATKLAKTSADAASALRHASAALKAGAEEMEAVARQLARLHEVQDAEYRELQARDQKAGETVRLRAEAEQAVAELESLERERGTQLEQIERLRKERAALRGQYLLELERVSTLRSEIAQQLQAEAGGKVRVRVMRNADAWGYRSMLLEGLKGARVKNHEDILDCLLRLRPDQLAQIITDQDVNELQAHTDLGEDRCRRILDAFRSNLDPFALEVTALEDKVTIELNVSTTTEPNFKDASELSRGQKCTALLPLLLARRDSPLVIDQPEDNLDNHFIYETVVESILRLKPRRQMIFITHNANIPVLGDAELVVVLDSDGKRGFVCKQGTLDECRDEIVDLLEGGSDAFELRRRRYLRGR